MVGRFSSKLNYQYKPFVPCLPAKPGSLVLTVPILCFPPFRPDVKDRPDKISVGM